MDDISGTALTNDHAGYRGLRDWIEKVDGFGELLRVDNASWDAEMGSITQMMTEKSRGNAPALLFDNIPDYESGYRTLYGSLSSIKRVALTLGLPLAFDRKVDIVQQYYDRMQNLKLIPPKMVETGPVMENVMTGDDIDVL